ncbi:CopG family transcriptional regulator [Protofrankia sp. BMG5.30]|nr:CopG family transcriptional regulator [Protofrankia sp. BMG5.30]
MVEEEYLQIVKEAAAREGRPESEYFREAFRIAALHARRWSGDWDIPALDFGGPLTEDDVREAIDEAVNRKNGTTGIAT